jgi:hypothetical protein
MSKPVSQPISQSISQPTGQPSGNPQMTRRVVFAGAGTAGALAAAAALLPGVETEAPVPTQPQAGAEGQGGYQVTEHVLRYYQTARV